MVFIKPLQTEDEVLTCEKTGSGLTTHPVADTKIDGIKSVPSFGSPSKSDNEQNSSSGKQASEWNNLKQTDYLKQFNPTYREHMLFRYKYLFDKPEKELMPFELALKWFLKFKNYPIFAIQNSMIEMNTYEIRYAKSLENDCDGILQSYKIPITLIEDYAWIEKATDRTIVLKKVYGSIYDD